MPGVEPSLRLCEVIEAADITALQSGPTPQVAAVEPFATLVRMAAHVLQAPIAMITLIGRDQQWIKAAYGTELERLPRALALCGHAIVEPSGAMVVPDTLADMRFRDHPLVLAPPYIRFFAGVCMVDSDGDVMGTLCVMDHKPSSIGSNGLALLHKMAIETVDALVRQQTEQAALQDYAIPVGHRRNEQRENSGWASGTASNDPALHPMLKPSPVRPSAPGWLGIRTEHVSVPSGEREGRWLLGVAAGSPAERAGLRVGDILLAIDGHTIRRRDDITAALASSALGAVMRLRVWRTGRLFERDVRLEPMPKERASQRRGL